MFFPPFKSINKNESVTLIRAVKLVKMSKTPFTKLLSIFTLGWALFATRLYAETLRIAIPNNGYAPFIVITEPTPKGILIDPLLKATDTLGINVDFQFFPEKRSRDMLDKGLVDARMESTKWVTIPKNYYWSVPIVSLDDVLVFNKNTEFSFNNFEDLIG